jgi:hypothetical protein
MMWDSAGVEAGRILDRDTVFSNLWFGLVGDASDGAIVTWPQALPDQYWRVLAQRVDGARAVCWDSGLAICDYGPRSEPPILRSTSNAKGGALGCWWDLRFGWPDWSVYAQRYGDAPEGLAESRVSLPLAARWACPSPLRAGATISLPRCGELDVTLDLFDACGRKVLDLQPGANDVRGLAPGVYFVRGPKTEDGRPDAAVRKIILTE